MARSTLIAVLWIAVATLVEAASAQAPARLDVRTPPSSGLCAAVRVQFGAEAQVRCGPPSPHLPPARLTAWLSAPDAQGERTLHARDAQGARRAQALREDLGPALERTVALKLGQWWTPARSTAAAASLAHASSSTFRPARAKPYLLGALAGTFSGPVGDTRLQPALWASIAAGVHFAHGGLRLELGPVFQIALPARWSDPPRSLELRDRSLGLWAALQAPLGPISLGPWAQVLAHALDAHSKAGASRDADQRWRWGIATGLSMRTQVAPWLSLEAALGFEALPHRQRYRVAGTPLADLGHVRGVGRLGAVVHWPSRRAPK